MNERFNFKVGDDVICNGYRGTVIKVCEGVLDGMVEVRLGQRGAVCVSASAPDCFPHVPHDGPCDRLHCPIIAAYQDAYDAATHWLVSDDELTKMEWDIAHEDPAFKWWPDWIKRLVHDARLARTVRDFER